MGGNPAFSVTFLWLLLVVTIQQCPSYVENCPNCSAEVSVAGKVTTLSQCFSCPNNNLTYTHTVLALNRSQGCVGCHYTCKV